MLTEEQRINRRNGIGASDSAIIMGFSSYKTPYELYLEKTGLIDAEEEITEAQYWGNALEPIIIERFAKENGVEISFPDTIYHPDYPFIFANLDGWIASENAVVEAKSANQFMKKDWDLAQRDGIPMNYLIQVAKQVAVTNATKGYCAVLIGGMEYKQFIYERDKALEEIIIQSDIDFWEKVQNRIEPDPINTSDCRLKFRSPSRDKCAQCNFQIEQVLMSISDLKFNMKLLQQKEDEQKIKLMQHMQDAEYLIGQDGEIMATWKANKNGTRVFNIK